MSAIDYPDERINLILPRAFTTLLSGLLLTVLALSALAVSYQYQHSGRVYPGVSVAGVDLSGLPPEDGAARLWEQLTYPSRGRIAFQDGDTVWVASPAELGLVLNANDSALAAYNVGRSGNPVGQLVTQFQAWFYGVDLPPQMVYDERAALAYLLALAETVDRPTIEAAIGVDGIEVQMHPGQVGRTMDVDATLAAIGPQLQTMTDGLIPLVVEEAPPIIFDASEQAELARQILSAPLVLTIPNANEGEPRQWVIAPETLAGMLAVERVAGDDGSETYRVGVSADKLRAFLENIAPNLEVTPANARFIFDDDASQLEAIEPSLTGRSLLVAETIDAINQKLAEGEHTIELVFDYALPPAPDTATAADLGITGLVSAQTSYFYGSSAPRMQNIKVAASRFHGLLVPPGATFSMADILGDVTLDTGFAEALIIFGDRTIKGVGGGVCQVSTTLFRTVFFGGYQVDERYSHAYRVYYYELTANGSQNANLAGLDATVYVPLVDFKFTNDSPYWLLMETYVNVPARSLIWKFYSTSDGRTVEWNTSGLQNKTEPPAPLYVENPKLAKGTIKQVDWAVTGATVTVTRTVYRDGETVHENVFTTNYRPWRAVYEYGPGTKLPKGDDRGG
ncbi:MAG: VanW family protein [Anaerolineales bacterium]